MGGKEMSLIQEAFDTNWIAPLGPHVEAFERECAPVAGMSAGLALSSGTAAMLLAARLIGLGPGDIVFCSSLTFVASVAPLVQMGASPVFIDSEPESWNMSPQALKSALKKAEADKKLPKAVILVNLYGQSCDMDELIPLCLEYDIPIIEDAAESMGAFYKGKPSGSFGHYSFFSFNGNKIITTSGGGMLFSNDSTHIDKARFWATQARDNAPWYQHSDLGYNYRMSNVLAAIGRGQLLCLKERVSQRRAVFERYTQTLGDISGLSFMPEPSWSTGTRWLTALTIDEKQLQVTPLQVIEKLAEDNIEARPVWKPMHLQPVFAQAPYFPHAEGLDVSEHLFKTGICLPSGSNLTHQQQERVIKSLRSALSA